MGLTAFIITMLCMPIVLYLLLSPFETMYRQWKEKRNKMSESQKRELKEKRKNQMKDVFEIVLSIIIHPFVLLMNKLKKR